MLLLLIALLAIAALLRWSGPQPSAPVTRVEISTDAAGVHRLDGTPVTLAELEARLVALAAKEKPLFIAIAGPSRAGGRIWPSPEIEALLARLKLSWMARPEAGLAQDGPAPEAPRPRAP